MGGRRWWWLASAALILSTSVVAAAQPPAPPAQDPLAGSRVFGAKGCARCHAINGVGGKIGPDLARLERPRSFYDLAAGLWNHAPRMTEKMKQLGIPRPQLDGRESANLAAFLFTVNYFDPPGNADAGRRLFTEKRCIVCHQAGGTGGVVGPNLDALKEHATPISLAAEMWNHGGAMAAAMRARNIARPSLSGAELRDLLAFLGSTPASAAAAPVDTPLYVLPGNAEQGRRLFTEKRCGTCHSNAAELAQRLRGGAIDLAAAMWNKAPAMMTAMTTTGVPTPHLDAAEMSDILAYLNALRFQGTRGGDPRKGLALATAKGCLTCHASGAEPGKPAVSLTQARGVDTPGGALAALWNHSFLGEVRSGGATSWAPMSGEEMADLMAYLQSTRRSR